MKRKYLAPSIDFHYITAKPEKQETNVLPSLPPLDQASHVTNHQLKKTCHENKFFMDRMFNCHNRL